jgi:hypothetical protein
MKKHIKFSQFYSLKLFIKYFEILNFLKFLVKEEKNTVNRRVVVS